MALPLTYKQRNCFINAYINKLNHYKDKNLKMVIGSLGINGWFEYGGKDWKKEDFKKRMEYHCSDSHCWLEDEEGNVYDMLFKEYKYWVEYRTHQPMKRVGLIEGVSKEELARDGIVYLPACKDTQTMLFLNTYSFIKKAYAGLQTGKYQWIGSALAMNFDTEQELREAIKTNGQGHNVVISH